MKVANRLVWANGFTNDKRAFSNKEPYRKQCNKCRQKIWMSPKDSKWQALNNDGSKHTCKKKPKRAKGRKTKCRMCGEDIVFKKLRNKWQPHDKDGQRHRCKVQQDHEMNMQHMRDI